jgi:hypothetical protein
MEQARPEGSNGPASRIDADEIESVSLAEQVRAMAGDSRTGGVRGDPFAPEREVNEDRRKHSRILVLVMTDD